jgi:hypothetical protein
VYELPSPEPNLQFPCHLEVGAARVDGRVLVKQEARTLGCAKNEDWLADHIEGKNGSCEVGCTGTLAHSTLERMTDSTHHISPSTCRT